MSSYDPTDEASRYDNPYEHHEKDEDYEHAELDLPRSQSISSPTPSHRSSGSNGSRSARKPRPAVMVSDSSDDTEEEERKLEAELYDEEAYIGTERKPAPSTRDWVMRAISKDQGSRYDKVSASGAGGGAARSQTNRSSTNRKASSSQSSRSQDLRGSRSRKSRSTGMYALDKRGTGSNPAAEPTKKRHICWWISGVILAIVVIIIIVWGVLSAQHGTAFVSSPFSSNDTSGDNSTASGADIGSSDLIESTTAGLEGTQMMSIENASNPSGMGSMSDGGASSSGMSANSYGGFATATGSSSGTYLGGPMNGATSQTGMSSQQYGSQASATSNGASAVWATSDSSMHGSDAAGAATSMQASAWGSPASSMQGSAAQWNPMESPGGSKSGSPTSNQFGGQHSGPVATGYPSGSSSQAWGVPTASQGGSQPASNAWWNPQSAPQSVPTSGVNSASGNWWSPSNPTAVSNTASAAGGNSQWWSNYAAPSSTGQSAINQWGTQPSMGAPGVSTSQAQWWNPPTPTTSAANNQWWNPPSQTSSAANQWWTPYPTPSAPSSASGNQWWTPNSAASAPTASQGNQWWTPYPGASSAASPMSSAVSGSGGGYQGQATWYQSDNHVTVCGVAPSDNDYVVALSTGMYQSGITTQGSVKSDFCGRKMMVRNSSTNSQVLVNVADECAHCAGQYGIDLSKAAFSALEHRVDLVSIAELASSGRGLSSLSLMGTQIYFSLEYKVLSIFLTQSHYSLLHRVVQAEYTNSLREFSRKSDRHPAPP